MSKDKDSSVPLVGESTKPSLGLNWLYVNWIPTHYSLTDEQIYEIDNYLDLLSRNLKPNDGHNSYYKLTELCRSEKGIGKIINSEPEMDVFVWSNGLFMAEVSFSNEADLEKSRQLFETNAATLYRQIRDKIHVHLFEHILSESFRLLVKIDDQSFKSNIVSRLERNYFSELSLQKSWMDGQRKSFVSELLDAINRFKISKDVKGPLKRTKVFFINVLTFLSWWYYDVPNLIEKRVKLCWLLERVINVSGVQTFVNSYRRLTCSSQVGHQDQGAKELDDSFTAHAIYRDAIKEYGEVIGMYTLQTYVFVFGLLALASPFIVIAFSSIFPSLCIQWKLAILGVFILIYYTSCFVVAKRIAKRYEEVTFLFFLPKQCKGIIRG